MDTDIDVFVMVLSVKVERISNCLKYMKILGIGLRLHVGRATHLPNRYTYDVFAEAETVRVL